MSQDAFVELRFETTDPAYPAVDLSAGLDCRVDLLDFMRADDGLTIFVRLRDGGSGDLADRVEGRQADVEILQTVGDEVLAAYTPERSILGTLARDGVVVQSAVATDGVVTITAVVPAHRDCRAVVERVQTEHPSVTFAGKRGRNVVAPLVTEAGVRSLFGSLLTDRQWEAMRLAYERGHFGQPQQASQTALADEMGISQKTFSQHLNAAQRKLLSVVFGD
jgi:predicted DNA binding protein